MPNNKLQDNSYNHPQYINVPFFILQDEQLDFFNKFLFGFFWGLAICGKRIKVSNPYLSQLFKVDESYIGKRIKELEQLGYITRSMIRYRRVIEVNHLIYNPIDFENSAKIKLVPPTGGGSTEFEQGTPVGGGGSSYRRGGGPPTGVPDIILDTIEDIKTNNPYPLSVDKVEGKTNVEKLTIQKTAAFGLEHMLENNPHDIPETFIVDWLEVRKSRKARMTSTAWTGTNSVLTKLAEAGLNPVECFEMMVTSAWQGIKVSYFEKEIALLKSKPPLKYVQKDERAAEYERIANREREAESRKKAEIEASKGFKGIVQKAKQHMGYQEIKRRQDADRMARGMTPKEYHDFITKNESTMSENIV